jgi:hypothetical protein
MNKLSDTANRLLFYLQKYTPSFAQKYNPGISRTEIQAALQPFQYELPNDFYELYEWRNGNPEWFNHPIELAKICAFSSIDRILGDLKNDDWDWDIEEDSKYKKFSTVPFVDDGACAFFSVVLGRSYEEEAHIAFIHMGGGGVHLCYDSITSMLESEVAHYELGAIYPTDKKSFHRDENFLGEKLDLGAEILRSKNPKTLTEAMSDLKNGLGYLGQDDEIDDYNYGNLVDPIFSALATLRMLRPPEAIELVQDRLGRFENKSSNRIDGARSGLSQWLVNVMA